MSLNANATELTAALKTLRELWEGVREAWRDGVADEFEATVWKTLEAQVNACVQAMDRLTPTLSKAQRDCE
jgi:uncharacterized protein YukE